MAKLKVGDIVKFPASFKDRKNYRVVGVGSPEWAAKGYLLADKVIVVPNRNKSNYEERSIQFTKLLKKVK